MKFKTKLKHILRVPLNKDEAYGKVTSLMIWSPVHHYWLSPYNMTTDLMTKKEIKFLMNQEVVRMGLRNDKLDSIAIFLKDYGKEKNKKLYNKYCK